MSRKWYDMSESQKLRNDRYYTEIVAKSALAFLGRADDGVREFSGKSI
jgi:hypothetical protein